MRKPVLGILHYTAQPVIGGVESVIAAHARLLRQADFPLIVIAGRGDQSLLPSGVNLQLLPDVDSQHEDILDISRDLESGHLPSRFDAAVEKIAAELSPIVNHLDHLIVHNVFTKHFNLPLTAALYRLIDDGTIRHAVAWCHDITWTSPHSRSRVHPGYPWDLLRTFHPDITYVTVSEQRQQELSTLLACDPGLIKVIYNGVDPHLLLGISSEGLALIERLGMLNARTILLMPVRVTQAKNVEYALQVVAALKLLHSDPLLILTGPPDPHDPDSMQYYRSLLLLRRKLDVERAMRFVFESGPHPGQPYFIDEQIVGDLFRLSDALFMPSHREGFGMPVLEAGLSGVPVFCTEFPASVEIGKSDVIRFSANQPPLVTAEEIVQSIAANPLSRFRQRVRLEYTWQAIFQHKIIPIIDNGEI